MTRPGTLRACALFASCAIEPCEHDATVEALHAPPGDGSAVWVPMCAEHVLTAHAGGLEYIVEVHGFIPPVSIPHGQQATP